MAADPIRDLDHAPGDPFGGGPEMTLIEHLIELRNRILWCAIALVVGCLVCFYFWEVILGWLIAPAREHDATFRLGLELLLDGIAREIAASAGAPAAEPEENGDGRKKRPVRPGGRGATS